MMMILDCTACYCEGIFCSSSHPAMFIDEDDDDDDDTFLIQFNESLIQSMGLDQARPPLPGTSQCQ